MHKLNVTMCVIGYAVSLSVAGWLVMLGRQIKRDGWRNYWQNFWR